MSEILFKRLFEVRILHGYYLDNWFADASGKKGIFQEFGANDTIRKENQAFLLENKYNILRDLSIEPTAETERLLRDMRMRWRTTPTGFIVGLEVEKQGADAAAKFFPKYPLPDKARWTFVMRTKNVLFSSFTNHALRPTMPARYYFTNLIPPGENKTYPSLSMHLPLFSSIPNRTWEMGELTRSGNNVRAAKMDTDNGTIFTEVFNFNNNWHHFAHSFDRKVLPKSFLYRFDPKFEPGNPVNNATFSLTDLNGTLVKSISRVFTAAEVAPRAFPLDFQYQPIPPNATEAEKLKPKPIPDGWYNLAVRINNAAFESRRVLLRSDLVSAQSVFGFIDISSEPSESLFSLFNADTSLNLQPVPDVAPLRWQGPVFEIRLLGRLAYWQYQLSKPLNPAPGDPDFEISNNNQTVQTVKPRRFVSVRATVRVNVTPGTDIFLPTPEPSSLKYNFEKKHYYTETFLSTL